jgi:hypothetical protein|nr:hypothetical protein [uncultured Emticicia sp.]
MKKLTILIILFVPLNLVAQQKEPCNVIYKTNLYFKKYKFREEINCRFDKKLYNLKKDSIRVINGVDDKDTGQFIKYFKEKYGKVFNKNIVIFSMFSHPQLFIAELNKDSILVLFELKIENDDDERNYDDVYNISSEFYLVDINKDKQPELLMLLVDEGGSFRIKIYKFELLKENKIQIKRVFRSEEMRNYYNESYCEGEQCKFIDLINDKIFIKTSPMSTMDKNEDLNLRFYEKRKLLKYNLIKMSYEIY